MLFSISKGEKISKMKNHIFLNYLLPIIYCKATSPSPKSFIKELNRTALMEGYWSWYQCEHLLATKYIARALFIQNKIFWRTEVLYWSLPGMYFASMYPPNNWLIILSKWCNSWIYKYKISQRRHYLSGSLFYPERHNITLGSSLSCLRTATPSNSSAAHF